MENIFEPDKELTKRIFKFMDEYVDTFIGDLIVHSDLFRQITADAKRQEDGSWLTMCHEGVIKVTESFEDLLVDMQAAGEDKGLKIAIVDINEHDKTSELFLAIAKMTTKGFARYTLIHYMHDACLIKAQLCLASHCPWVFDDVEPGHIFESAQSALALSKA